MFNKNLKDEMEEEVKLILNEKFKLKNQKVFNILNEKFNW
jgi:hypothetical protein